MKKLLTLGLVLGAVTLTGCTKSKPTYDFVQEILEKIENRENVVYTTTEYKYAYAITKNTGIKRLVEYKEEITYTFYDGLLKIETYELDIDEEGGSSSKDIRVQTEILDFANGMMYFDYDNTGYYTGHYFSNTFEKLYDYYLNTTYINYFIDGDELLETYEQVYSSNTNFYEIFTSGSNNLIIFGETFYDSSYTEVAYSKFEFEESYELSYTFKDSVVTIPSDEYIY